MPRKRRGTGRPKPSGSGEMESEFGVPIPGSILPEEAWARTALKKLPQNGAIDIDALFGRHAPLVVDIGCGNGRFSIGSAWSRKDHDHLAADILPVVIRYATRRGNQRGLTNLRFCVVDGERLVTQLLPASRAREVHCYHPQPFPRPGEGSVRLINPFFLAEIIRVLEVGGLFVVQTDNAGYWKQIKSMANHFFKFQELNNCWPDAPQGRSRREIYALMKGLKVYRGFGSPIEGINYKEAIKLSDQLAGRDR